MITLKDAYIHCTTISTGKNIATIQLFHRISGSPGTSKAIETRKDISPVTKNNNGHFTVKDQNPYQ